MIRRRFLQALGLPAVAAAAERAPRYDILIRNGEVVDPGRGFRKRADVAVSGGRIVAIEESIPPERGLDVIDARGLYVTPGLIDLHTHCCHAITGSSIEADPIAARSGVSTWVDAGSFGWDQAAGFRRFIVRPQQARVFGFIHLYANLRNPDVDVVKYVRDGVKRTGTAATSNSDIILGIKVYVGSGMNGRYSLDFLKIGRELCDQFKLPMMVHISESPPQTPQVMELLRAGDIVTHCFTSLDLGMIDPEGRLKPSVRDARLRGVLFDVGHGAGSFNFATARKALDAGFPPDTISTDLYNINTNGPVYDLPTTLSKFLHLGMSLEDVLLRATANAAKVVGRVPGLGSLQVDGPADIALLAMEEGEFRLTDADRNSVTTPKRLVSRLTVCRGKRVGVLL